jgi:hypothetical protein
VFAPAVFDAIRRTQPGIGGEIQNHRRDPGCDAGGGKVYGVAPARRRAPLRHRQLPAYFPGLRRVRAGGRATGPALRKHLEALLDHHRKHACARAALLGNPSDGYHGRTIAVIIRDFRAEVVSYEWDSLDTPGRPRTTASTSSRFHDLARDVELHGYYGG